MSNIIVRTAYWEKSDNVVRFYDWAKSSHTTLGTVVEPFLVNGIKVIDSAPGGIPNVDYTGEMIRVHHLEHVDFSYLDVNVFGDGTRQLHGGNQYPRTGR